LNLDQRRHSGIVGRESPAFRGLALPMTAGLTRPTPCRVASQPLGRAR
jgi:hypothetical protein